MAEGAVLTGVQEAYEKFEKASRFSYGNGHIGHTWTEKSAFEAGWKAAENALSEASKKGAGE